MSYATEQTAILTRFHTEWKAAQGFTDTQYAARVATPNRTFTPPSGQSWVRLNILPAASEQETMQTSGTATYLYDGTVSVQVFVPTNTGPLAAKTLAEQVCVIFRGVEAGGIIYDAPYVTVGGNGGAGWYMLNVWCPYRRETTH